MSAPHRAAGTESICGTLSDPVIAAEPHSFYVCTAQAGHDGPQHVAFDANGRDNATWPTGPSQHRSWDCWCGINHHVHGLVLG